MQPTMWRWRDAWASLVFFGALPFVPLNVTLPEWSHTAGAVAVGLGLLLSDQEKRGYAMAVFAVVLATHEIHWLNRAGALVLVLGWMFAVVSFEEPAKSKRRVK